MGREGGLEWRASTLRLVPARTRREVGTLWALAWGQLDPGCGKPVDGGHGGEPAGGDGAVASAGALVTSSTTAATVQDRPIDQSV